MVKQTVNATVEIDLEDLATAYTYEDGSPGMAPILAVAVEMVAKKIEKEIEKEVIDIVKGKIEKKIESIVEDAITKTYQPKDEFGMDRGKPTSLEAHILKLAQEWVNNLTKQPGYGNRSGGQKWIHEKVDTILRKSFDEEFKKYNEELRKYMRDFVAGQITARTMK